VTSDKPAPVFNLDTFQAEGELKPFSVNFGSQLYEFRHLDELDGFGVLEAFTQGEAQSTLDVLRMALGDEKFNEFRKKRPSRAMLDALIKRYLRHCGIDLGKSNS
jgi:hypothetical protein